MDIEKRYIVVYNQEEEENACVFDLIINDVVEPGELEDLGKKLDQIKGDSDNQGLCLVAGKAPIWVYGYVLHKLHPTAAVGVYDPRMGYIIIQSHSKKFQEGSIWKEIEPIWM